MNRTARRYSDTVGNQAVAGRRQIRPADSNMIRRHKCVCKVLEPVRVGIRIIIDIGNDLTASSFTTCVARTAQTSIFCTNEAKWVLPCDFSGVVRRSIVHNNHFIVGIVQRQQPFKTLADHPAAVITADDDGDRRPVFL